MGYVSDVDFIAVQDSPTTVRIDWLAVSPKPTDAEIDAAAATAANTLATKSAQTEKSAAITGIDQGDTVAGTKVDRLTRAIVLTILDETNRLRRGVPHRLTSIARSGTTGTATSEADHGLSPGDQVSIFGATLAAYNLTTTAATTPTARTFTYTGISGNPTTPAAGSLWFVRGNAGLPDVTPQQVVDAVKARIQATAE
jgi:hypothetical protein